jgi:hypothetical protein
MTPPPINAVTPQPEHAIVTVVTGAIVAGLLIYSLVMWKRRGTPLYLVMLGAGLVCVINEVPLSYAGHFYYPRPDAWEAFEAYERVIPFWWVFAYTIYVGGLSIGMSEWLRRGITRQRVWIGVGTVCLLNAILEVTVLRTENYFYYGEQPLRIDNFPAIWMAMNVVAVLGSCVIVHAFGSYLTGPRMLLLLAAIPLAQIAGDWFGTPHFVALNSGGPHWVLVLCSLISIGLCALVVDFMARYLARTAPTILPSVRSTGGYSPHLAGRNVVADQSPAAALTRSSTSTRSARSPGLVPGSP